MTDLREDIIAADPDDADHFETAARIAFDRADLAAKRASAWHRSDVEGDRARAPDQARLAAEWLRIARDLDAARAAIAKAKGK